MEWKPVTQILREEEITYNLCFASLLRGVCLQACGPAFEPASFPKTAA